MKKVLLTLLPLFMISLSCGKYDDTAIWDKVNDLDARVTQIERTLAGLNNDLVKMQLIVDALQKQISITSVVPLTGGGFIIRFSDGSSYTIESGKDGNTPYIGANGHWWIGQTDTGTPATGSDGQTPFIGSNGNWWIGLRDTGVPATGTGTGDVAIIGIREYNGRYYWTQTIGGTTTWLTDQYGNMIPVSGNDGTTPILRVSADGWWIVSYDGGSTFEYILDANGNKVKATCGCESFFQSVTYEDGVLVLVLMDGTVLTLDLNEQKDTRMDQVVPVELQEKISQYIPLYSGINPPKVEGCYLMSPATCVYCEDYGDAGYAPGTIMNDMYLRFMNQNPSENTVDYSGCQGGIVEHGNGAFICGHGNYFTAYFDTEGEDSEYGVTYKIALVISGTVSEQGIKDCYYAFIMTEKHGDTGGHFMKEGVFRVFDDGDGLAEKSAWPVLETEMVDMGLPSGVKWANTNLGASSPEESGNYYAWGETATKSSFTLYNYPMFDSETEEFSKYCTDEAWGTVDGKTTLELADDAAYAALGAGWRTPTITDWIELFNNSSQTWTQKNGVNGYEITSSANGNKLFLPAAGAVEGDSPLEVGNYGVYWSSSLYEDVVNSYAIIFASNNIIWSQLARYYGYSVRPVYGTSAAVSVTKVSLNRSTLSLKVGESSTLYATVTPSNAANRLVYWTSEDESVATVNDNGVVTAVGAGSTRVRVRTLDGGKMAYCTVTVTASSKTSAMPSSSGKVTPKPNKISDIKGHSIYK